MITKNIEKKILSYMFITVLFVGFVKGGSYIKVQRVAEYLKQDTALLDDEDALTVDALESEFTSSLWNRRKLINFNGIMARLLDMQGFYSDINLYVTDNMYIVSASDYTTTDYEFNEIVAFKEFLDQHEINLLYINEPTKYIDDDLFREQFGVETYSNQNMDMFISRIKEAGIATIDLRDSIEEENLDVCDLFYRTDHHWTTEAGLWAAQIIADGLNEYFNYHIDTSIYDESNFTLTEWTECWLGEQGKKVAETYVGLDDYTEIKPIFTTNYTFKNSKDSYEGTFDDFINEDVYNLDNDVYENSSWHYSYQRIDCINNDVEFGKVLILGDSYDQITVPFISLGVHEVDSLVLRACDDSFDLRNYILENGYDTVLICYAQFMLGAHDDPNSSNYRMFTFE